MGALQHLKGMQRWWLWVACLFLLAHAALAAQAPGKIDQAWRDRFVMRYFASALRDRGQAQRAAVEAFRAARAGTDLKAQLQAAARYFLIAEAADMDCKLVSEFLRKGLAGGQAHFSDYFDVAVAAAGNTWGKRCEGSLSFEQLDAMARQLGDDARLFFVLEAKILELSRRDQFDEILATRYQQQQYVIAPFQRAYCIYDIAQTSLRANPKGAESTTLVDNALREIDASEFPGLHTVLTQMKFRVKQAQGDIPGALQIMEGILPAVRRGVLGPTDSTTLMISFARALSRAGRDQEALQLLNESASFGATAKTAAASRSRVIIEILTKLGTPSGYARGIREVQNLNWLLADAEHFGPASVRNFKTTISNFHQKFGNFEAALTALQDANKASEEAQKRSSEKARIELLERLNVAAKDKENARLKADAELQAARQRGWIVAFGAAAMGVAAAGGALAVAMRRGRRLAKVSAELEQRNAELEQRSATRIRLLAAACHDLRQPAHALGLLAELGGDAQREPSRFVAWLQSVRRSTASLGDMLDELMDLGRLDGGHYTPQLSDVSLAELLQEVMLHFGGLAKRKGLTLEVPPAEGVIVSDRHLLRRVLFNVVSNAIKYTDTGFVRVSVQPDGDAVQLTVQDSGPGIPPDKLDDVFRDYVRLNPTKASEGLGIGLSIVRRAAELLGHGLTLASPPGQGTTVTLRLRKSEAPQTPEVDAKAEEASAAQGVLALLEDDTDVRDAMAALLRLRGYTVYAGPSAAAVLAQLQESQFKPQLVITDLHLEGGDGLDELAQLRDALASPHLPALLVTGDLDAAIATQAAQAGVFVAHKPLAPRKLASLVNDLLHAPKAVAGSQNAWAA